jgi:hypothetical protein
MFKVNMIIAAFVAAFIGDNVSASEKKQQNFYHQFTTKKGAILIQPDLLNNAEIYGFESNKHESDKLDEAMSLCLGQLKGINNKEQFILSGKKEAIPSNQKSMGKYKFRVDYEGADKLGTHFRIQDSKNVLAAVRVAPNFQWIDEDKLIKAIEISAKKKKKVFITFN